MPLKPSGRTSKKPPLPKDSLGAAIKTRRKKKHVSQTSLAKYARVTHPTISAYERGTQFPSEAVITRIGECLDYDFLPLWREEQKNRGSLRGKIKNKEKKDALLDEGVRGLLDQASDAMIIFEPGTEVIIVANQHACQMYGYEKHELEGRSLKEMTVDVAAGEQKIKQTLKEGRYFNHQTVQRRKDGTEIMLEINASVIRLNNKPYIWSINRDVTEQRANENKLAELKSILDAVPVGLFAVDAEGRPYYYNRTAVETLGKTAEPDTHAEQLPKAHGIFRSASKQVSQSKEMPIMRALRSGEKVVADNFEISRRGERVPLFIWSCPVLDEDGKIKFAVSAFVETTEIAENFATMLKGLEVNSLMELIEQSKRA